MPIGNEALESNGIVLVKLFFSITLLNTELVCLNRMLFSCGNN
jgi:hypothetical protein